MAQKIKVQDGNIVYSNTDPSQPVNMAILGDLNVTNTLIVGDLNAVDFGVIKSLPGTPDAYSRLDIIAGNYGSLNISQTSSTNSVITINSVQWPNGDVHPQPGMVLGATSLNKLDYIPLIIAYNPNDFLSQEQLNVLYPLAISGQSVAGITVLYICVGEGTWRILGQPTIISKPLNQIVFGTGSGISSDAGLTFDNISQTLNIGLSGSSSIEANVGEPMIISSDTSITLLAGNNSELVVDNNGNVYVGMAGPSIISSNVGQSMKIQSDTSITLSINGANSAIVNNNGAIFSGFVQFGQYASAPSSPVNGMVYYDTTLGKFRGYESGAWVTLAGGNTTYPTLIVRLFNNTPADFNRVYTALSVGVTQLPSTEAVWDPDLGQIVLNEPGYWRVIVQGRAQPIDVWPNVASCYGTVVEGALDYQTYSQYYKTATGVFNNDWSSLSTSSYSPIWTDEFIVRCDYAPQGIPINMFVEAYDGTPQQVVFSGTATVQRISTIVMPT